MAQQEIIDRIDEALTRFMLARARFERERGPVIVLDEQRRWTGQDVRTPG